MQPKDRIEHIKNWIFNYVTEMPNPANCLVVGISGGIDSSVVSTISAMTGLKTLIVCMPIHQRP